MQRPESGGLQRVSAKPIRVVQDRRPFAPEGNILELQDLYQEDVYLHLRTQSLPSLGGCTIIYNGFMETFKIDF